MSPAVPVLRQFFRAIQCSLLWTTGGIVSCEAPENRALKVLARSGIEASGRSLVEAVAEADPYRTDLLLAAKVHTEHIDSAGRTPLRIALEAGDFRAVFNLIEAGADVNASAPDGTSVLAQALAAGETVIAEKLITRGARADGLMKDGERILPWAIRKGRLVAVRAMLRSGADPHATDRNGSPLVHLAMAAGRREIVGELLELGADPAAVDSNGETVLHLALRHEWLDSLPGLAAAGADPNRPAPDQPTLLQIATVSRRADLVEALLAAGADPYLVTAGAPQSPVDTALAVGDSALLEVFLHHKVRLTGTGAANALRQRIESHDLSGARWLLAHGVIATSRGPDGLLPAEAAAAQGRAGFAKLLLDYGQPAGKALQLASARGDDGMVGLLLACGVHPNSSLPPSLETPLAAAIRGGHDRIACFLIRHGADPRAGLPEGQTPLHLALLTGCDETVAHLLDAGADPNLPFAHPVAPVFIKSARAGVIRWALRNDRNITPLMVAADSGDLETTRRLMAAGAKKSVWTRTARLWPINFASRRGDVKMMRLLLGQDPVREERHIVINLSQQKAWMYDRDGNEVFSTRVSTGKKGKPTPTGEFVITNKHRHWTSTIYDASMPYFQRLSCSDIGLHQGYVPGYPASSGCIRLPAGNASKLFAMTRAGDRVRIDP